MKIPITTQLSGNKYWSIALIKTFFEANFIFPKLLYTLPSFKSRGVGYESVYCGN